MKYNKTAGAWLLKHTRHLLPGVLVLSVLSMVTALAYLWLALLSKELLEAAQTLLLTGTGNTIWDALRQPALYVPALKVIGVVLGQIILHVVTGRLTVYASGKLQIRLCGQVFSSLLRADYTAVHGYHSGELITRLTSDVSVVAQGITGLLPMAASLIARLVGGVVLLVVLAPDLSLALIGIGVVTVIGSRIYGVRMKRLHKQCQEAYGKTRSFMQEALSHLLSVKAFAVEDAVNRELDAHQAEHFHRKLHRNRLQLLGSTTVYALMTVAYDAMLLWCVFGLAVGTVTVGTLAALIQVFEQLQAPLRNISGVLSQYYAIMASAERLQELDGTEPEPEAAFPDSPRVLADGFRRLVLSDVIFSYDEATPVLNGVNLTVERGECVALVGESGIGKSTLMKLILAILPCNEGSIVLEGETPLPVGAASRRLMAYVPQSNTLISGTLRENIAFFREVEEETLAEVVRLACLDEFVASLPDGLDTVVGERGFGVSEGQAQRVGIARALLHDAPLLLLDECTSALDAATEERLLGNLRALQDRAVLLISHKDTTVAGSDCVWRLVGGTLVPA